MQKTEENIKEKFLAIKSNKDLVNVLNLCKAELYGQDCKKISLKALNYYTNPKFCKKRYKKFSIEKKSGGIRNIHSPVIGLKVILRCLNFGLNCVYTPNKSAMGFVPGKSIVDNAKKHLRKNYVYNIDLQDFFHSFDRNRVKMAFLFEPFNFKKNESVAFLLASLVTHEIKISDQTKIVLPQGSPTSPTITNILCERLDRRLNGLAKRFKCNYSRYADDITFSSNLSVFKKQEFLDELNRIIGEEKNLKINQKKTRLQSSDYRQDATGLIINEKVNVRKTYVKSIRMWIYYWEKYGFKKASEIYNRSYSQNNSNLLTKPNFINVLEGKLNFLKMVKGENDSTYIKLKDRLVKLIGNSEFDIDEILKVWETDGLDKAFKTFSKENNGNKK